VAQIEASSTATATEAAARQGITRQAVQNLLSRRGYSYRALVAERRAIKAEVEACRKVVNRSRRLAPCGTRAAYARHLFHGEEPCVPCLDANAADTREREARRRDQKRPNRRRDSEETKAKKREAALRRHRGEA
jgi:hypothetical protein